jgi:hypothetical protein
MREGKLAIFFGSALTLLSAVARAGSAPPPKELYWKSIIVRWVEHHNCRLIGEVDFRDVDVRTRQIPAADGLVRRPGTHPSQGSRRSSWRGAFRRE